MFSSGEWQGVARAFHEITFFAEWVLEADDQCAIVPLKHVMCKGLRGCDPANAFALRTERAAQIAIACFPVKCCGPTHLLRHRRCDRDRSSNK